MANTALSIAYADARCKNSATAIPSLSFPCYQQAVSAELYFECCLHCLPLLVIDVKNMFYGFFIKV